MARIRSVKIGFFRNENLCVFSFAHRLLFEGLWLLADKAGRLEDRPKRIHADLFPFDLTLDVDAMLTELADGNDPFIQRYVVNGRRYIAVLNFEKHQRPNHREIESELPGPDDADILSPPAGRVFPGQSTVLPGQDKAEQEGNGEGNGEGEGKGARTPIARSEGPHDLAEAWNMGVSEPIPLCRELTDKRRTQAKQRIQDAPLEEWRRVIGRINASAFCRGENDRGWKATFDWLLQPDTRVKVLEGKYDSRARAPAGPKADDDWFEQCQALHGGKCNGRYQHGLKMQAAS